MHQETTTPVHEIPPVGIQTDTSSFKTPRRKKYRFLLHSGLLILLFIGGLSAFLLSRSNLDIRPRAAEPRVTPAPAGAQILPASASHQQGLRSLDTEKLNTLNQVQGSGKSNLGNRIDAGAAANTQLPNLSDNPVTKKVLVLIFNPKTTVDGREVTLSQYLGWSDYNKITRDIIPYMKESSHGMLNYVIQEQREVNEIPTYYNGHKHTFSSYMECWNDQSKCDPSSDADYEKIFQDYQICNKNVDEVWLWGAPYFGFAEWIPKNICGKTQFVMGFSYERGFSEAIHDFGHRMEGVMLARWSVPRNLPWRQNNQGRWNEFSKIMGGCGNIHNPPNLDTATDPGYTYDKTGSMPSACEDLLRFPSHTGVIKPVSCRNWNCTEAGFYQWWFKHIPAKTGVSIDPVSQKPIYNNWWKYWIYYDETFQNPDPVPAITFSNLSARLEKQQAMFTFTPSREADSYGIDLALDPAMSSVWYSFASGDTSPLTETSPDKWNEYLCGRTMYWRVSTPSGFQSDVQTAQINCDNAQPANPLPEAIVRFEKYPQTTTTVKDATLKCIAGSPNTGDNAPDRFQFRFGLKKNGTVDNWIQVNAQEGVNKLKSMPLGSGAPNLSWPTGAYSMVISCRPCRRGNALTNDGCNEDWTNMVANIAVTPTLGPPTTAPSPNTYSDLKATIDATINRATFEFKNAPRLPQDQVHVVDLALDSGMNSIWWSFATGKNSPILDTNPKKWNEVVCGKTLYWRVRSQENEYHSQITPVTVSCVAPPPTPDPCEDMVVKLQENDQAPLMDSMSINTDQRLNAVCLKRNNMGDGPIQDTSIGIANYNYKDFRWLSSTGKAVNISFLYGTTLVRCQRRGITCPVEKRSSVNTATVSASFPPRVAPYSGTVNKRTGNATFKFYTRKVAPNQVEIDLFPQENSTKSGLLSVAKGKTVPETTAPGTLNIFTVTNSQALRDWPSLECNSKIYWKIRNSRTNTYVLEAYTGIINVTCD